MTTKRATAILGGAIVAAAFTTSACVSSSQNANRPGTTPSTPSVGSATPGKLSAGDLQSRWWTWAASSVRARNPVADRDGAHCGEAQKPDIFFLAGTFGGAVQRTCSIPNSVPVAFPLVNLVGTTADCDDFMKDAEGSATVDGSTVAQDRFPATPITVTAVAGNPVTQSSGTMHGHGCGLWVQLPPFPAGDHKVAIRGKSGSFTVSVDYLLHVSAGTSS